MNTKRISDRNFFMRPTETVAQDLIGKILCHSVEDGNFVIKGRITATEAYKNDEDVTDANRSTNPTAQLLSGGHLHFHYKTAEGRKRIDIVTNESGIAESVLIAEIDMYNGPQKVVWAMNIGQDGNENFFDGLDLVDPNSPIWLEEDGISVEINPPVQRKNVLDTKPLRFTVKAFSFK